MPTFLPSATSVAARLTVSDDLPTPPLPEPMQSTLATAASDPSGSPPGRPSLRWRPDFSWSVSTSKPTFTRVTPSMPETCLATAFWKWPLIGQPGVVRETVTSTTPPSLMSMARTISSSTMSLRSSGSMTDFSASVICSLVGMPLPLWQALVVVLAVRRRADDVEVAVELDVDLAAVRAGDLDLVVALLVADLGLGHAARLRGQRGGLRLVQGAAADRLLCRVVVAAGRPGDRGSAGDQRAGGDRGDDHASSHGSGSWPTPLRRP